MTATVTLTKKIWTAIILLGFAGQLAWGVENQFFNTEMMRSVNDIRLNQQITVEKISRKRGICMDTTDLRPDMKDQLWSILLYPIIDGALVDQI